MKAAIYLPFTRAIMTKEMIISLLQTGEQGLTRTFDAVPDDKLNWAPLDKGRTALDAYGEAAQTCNMAAQIAQTKGHYKPSRETFMQLAGERAAWSKTDAMAAMKANSAALHAALENLSDEDLSQPVTMPIGGGMTLPLGGWVMMAYRSFISRFAQINYIQTLYGDNESH